MNILFIVNDAGVYGANLSLANLIKSLDLKNSLVLIPSKGPLLFLLDKMNIAYLVIPLDLIVQYMMDVFLRVCCILLGFFIIRCSISILIIEY